MKLIEQYFPALSQHQLEQLEQFSELFGDWNQKINMISRKDMVHFEERHLLHSLSIALFFNIPDHSKVLDVGTGGGFPGLPLAIYYPQVDFVLVDSIGKKIKVVEEIVMALKLTNVRAFHSRVEDLSDRYDYVSGRAVKSLPVFYEWVKQRLDPKSIKGGVLYLKGGDFDEELLQIDRNYRVFELQEKLKESFFETKKLVYIKT